MGALQETFIIDSDSHDHLKVVLNVSLSEEKNSVRKFAVPDTEENSLLLAKVKKALISELDINDLMELKMEYDKNNVEFDLSASFEKDGEVNTFEGHLIPVMSY